MRRIALLLLGLLALCHAPPASAAGLAETQRTLAGQMRAAGGGSGALVVDAATGARLYGARADVRRVPASVEKLYTTSTVLRRLGPESRLATELHSSAPLLPDGTLDGDLYLKGAGDPTFAAPQALTLARRLVAETGITEITGRVIGDETAFDRRRGPPSSGYVTSGYVGPLSALAFQRGLTGIRAPYFQASPGLFAAQAFDRILRREGVRTRERATTGAAPAGAPLLTALRSPAVAQLVARTNTPSDNYFAETLIKVLGARFDSAGTTAAGARVVRSTVGEMGIAPQVIDGSGLSPANRTSPRQVVTLLRAMTEEPALEASLPVAGRSGTLVGRMRGTAAAGNCRAKTGTLSSVSALAGYCTAADGVTRAAFAVLMNGVNPVAARRLQDRMAVALARYEP